MGRAVHQFHHAARRADAIGEEMLALRSLLRGAGYDSEIYAGSIDGDLSKDVLPFASYRGDPESLLLVHHSIGHHLAGKVASLPDREVLYYHNITPPRFFAHDPFMRKYAERGLRQLEYFRPRVLGAIGDSEFNVGELRRAGYEFPEAVAPVVVARSAARRAAAPSTPLILFVGRVAPNKRQDELIDVFDVCARVDPEVELVIVGEAGDDPFSRLVKLKAESSPWRERIHLTGRISDEERNDFYARASLYLSMSEHEGFGLPLLEAFARGIPVLAYGAAAVPETLAGAGVTFFRKDRAGIAAMAAELIHDRDLRVRVIAAQLERLKRPDLSAAPERFLSLVEKFVREKRPSHSAGRERRPLRVTIEGGFESSYGLAVANRQLAEALENWSFLRTEIHCTEGTGDYLPRSADLAGKSLARRLWERSFDGARPDVVIRNVYPPRFDKLNGRLNLAYFFWEDSLLPPGWGERFSRHFDAILAPSAHVREVLRASGVTVPVEIVPAVVESEIPVDDILPAVLPTKKKTRFLSIGSAFPRKGTDVLVRAFFRAFTAKDDVVLVLKTFPNVHNTVAELLAEMRRKNPDGPEVLHIDRDLPRSELLSLYRSADAFVHPARAEGFGLPAAEAMYFGVPVIAPSATGLADFCNEETALLVPHRMEPSKSHLNVPAAEWAEPDEEALARTLAEFASGRLRPEAKRRAAKALEFVRRNFSSQAVARRAQEVIEHLFDEKTRKQRLAFVATWNTRCGVATYTGHLTSMLPAKLFEVSLISNSDAVSFGADAENVARVWDKEGGGLDHIVNEALERGAEAVHLQFHASFYKSYRELRRVLEELCDRGIRVFVTFHMTHTNTVEGVDQPIGDLVPALVRCERIFVHHENDLARLAAIGLTNVAAVPHGGLVYPAADREAVARDLGLSGRRVVATFGFALPHKGLKEAIEAAAILTEKYPSFLFLALASELPEERSRTYLEECRGRIAELKLESHVYLYDSFLTEEEIGVLLSSAEAVVLPYHFTKESASGAIRYPLAAGRATITTSEKIFDDVAGVVHQIARATPAAIAAGIDAVLSDGALRERLEAAARRFASERSWAAAARAHLPYYLGREPSADEWTPEPNLGAAQSDGRRVDAPAKQEDELAEEREYLQMRLAQAERELQEAGRREADAREVLEQTRRAAAALATEKGMLQDQVWRYHQFVTDLNNSRLWRVVQAVRGVFGRAW